MNLAVGMSTSAVEHQTGLENDQTKACSTNLVSNMFTAGESSAGATHQSQVPYTTQD
jgi:hypothetical protein